MASNPQDGIVLIGTVAVAAGVMVLAINAATSGSPLGAYFFGALLIVSGLLLRIEAAVARAGSSAQPGGGEADSGA